MKNLKELAMTRNPMTGIKMDEIKARIILLSKNRLRRM